MKKAFFISFRLGGRFFIFGVGSAGGGRGGRAPPPGGENQPAPLSQTVPVDPLITVGTLPNGLRYYIRANSATARPAPSFGSSSTRAPCSKTKISAGSRTSSSI